MYAPQGSSPLNDDASLDRMGVSCQYVLAAPPSYFRRRLEERIDLRTGKPHGSESRQYHRTVLDEYPGILIRDLNFSGLLSHPHVNGVDQPRRKEVELELSGGN